MLTYQVKIKVDPDVESEWFTWMKTQHVPKLIETGLVISFQILKPEEELHTYLFQYVFNSKEDFAAYEAQYAPQLREHVKEYYPGKFTAERSLLHWV